MVSNQMKYIPFPDQAPVNLGLAFNEGTSSFTKIWLKGKFLESYQCSSVFQNLSDISSERPDSLDFYSRRKEK